MLICPECQSENPEYNKFCQHCGISLTTTNCHYCGTEISLIALSCDRCKTPNAKQLIALIVAKNQTARELELVNHGTYKSNEGALPLLGRQSAEITAHNIELGISTKNTNTKISQQYLDTRQRYYLASDLPQKQSSTFSSILKEESVIQTLVMDKFPLKESYLDILKKQQEELFTELARESDNSYLSVAQYWNEIGIPTIAIPYLRLQSYTPVIPAIYDTWQEADLGVLLLADRSSWELLTDFWSNRDIPEEQILWSLNEMLKIWTPLVKVGCGTTLLVQENLRIDEDQSFGFQQLHPDDPDYPPTLVDLAIKWHEWLSQSPEKYTPELEEILRAAIAEAPTTIEELREELYNLARPDSNLEATVKKDLLTLEHNERESFFYPNEVEEQPTASLGMQIASVSEASCTDVGSQRDHNEDFFGTKTMITQEESPGKKTISARGLYIVCDGMGGHSAGEVASAMAVETLQSYFHAYWQDEFPDEDVIREGILLANRTIYQTNVNHERSGNGMMGTTLVMALLQDTKLAIAHVGDSRIYRLTRHGDLEQLTQDHEVGQREINRGVEPEIAYGRPDAYQLTQALGPRDNKYIRPAIDFIEIQEDCLLLLCSDGLCDNQLLEKHWETYLQPLISSSADVQSGLFQLIDFADRYNGHDNITGILLRIKLQPNFEA
jgi:protein phosphatase